jgi:hypothetical protein
MLRRGKCDSFGKMIADGKGPDLVRMKESRENLHDSAVMETKRGERDERHRKNRYYVKKWT